MNDSQLPKTYLRWSTPRSRRNALRFVLHAARGLALFPIYWLLAYIVNTPGMHFRRRCLWVAGKVMLGDSKRDRFWRTYELIVQPMDSLRYFEFDFAWRCLRSTNQGRYLDVSSPRLLPLLFIENKSRIEAVLLNPDRKDLPTTRQMARELRVSERCQFVDKVIVETSFEDESFDLISSLSVVEHIPNDTAAIRKMWALLKPGGQLVLTVPCAQIASAEFVDRDEYELLGKGADGFVFWQRFYDDGLLQSRIFCVTGPPQETAIYGEKVAGTYAANVREKMSGEPYPTWREPFMMGRNFRVYESISQLPGMGVVGLLFVKPVAAPAIS